MGSGAGCGGAPALRMQVAGAMRVVADPIAIFPIRTRQLADCVLPVFARGRTFVACFLPKRVVCDGA